MMAVEACQWDDKWQWLGGNNINREIISMRFGWYRLESGNGSIKRDTVD
jgi:hypothetical protein